MASGPGGLILLKISMNDRRTVLERKEEQFHKNKGILRCGGIPEREKTGRNGRNNGPKRAKKPATQEDGFLLCPELPSD